MWKSAIYEYVGYGEYNKEGAYWEQIDEDARSWFRREGVIIEVDKYFVQVEISTSDWYVWQWDGEKNDNRLLDIEYSGRLEELLPQIFEVK